MSGKFNPDAYLAKKDAAAAEGRGSSGSFDPDAYLEAVRPKMSVKETAAVHGLTGLTVGALPALTGAANALLSPERSGILGPAMWERENDPPEEAAIKRAAMEQERLAPSDYEAGRDAMFKAQDKGYEDHPYVAVGSNLLGSMAAPLPGATELKGLSLGAKALKLGGRGVAQGTLYGANNSRAKLTRGEVGPLLLDAGLYGAGGGAAALAGLPAGALLAKFAKLIGLPQALESAGVDQGRRVILSGADSLKGNKELSEEAVRLAMDNGVVRAGSNSADAFARLEGLAAKEGDRYASIIKTLEEHGVQGPEAESIARKLTAESEDVLQNTLGSPAPKLLADHAAEVRLKPPPEGVMITPAGPVALQRGKRLLLTQSENIKRSLQEQAKKEYTRLGGDTILGDAKKRAASIVRQEIEDTIAAQAAQAPASSPVRAASDAFVPVKQKLGKLLEARDAAERGTAAAAKRSSKPFLATVALAAADPKLAVPMIANAAWKEYGPSTMASFAYNGGKAAAANGGLSPQLVQALERALLPENKIKAILGLPDAPLTEEEKRRRALAEAMGAP